MLLDLEMMRWVLDFGEVSFEMFGDSMLARLRVPRMIEPVEVELLFKFVAGFGQRIPALLRTDYGSAESMEG